MRLLSTGRPIDGSTGHSPAGPSSSSLVTAWVSLGPYWFSSRQPGRRDQRLLEGDALVARQDWLANPDQAIAVAHRRGNVRDLVAAVLPLLHRAAEPLKRFQEERLDIVGLEPASFGAFHVLADALNARSIHRVVNQGVFFQKIANLLLVQGIAHGAREARAYLGLLTVADCRDQQVAQRLAFEL